MSSSYDLDTGKIKDWRSIITLLVFIFTSEYPDARPDPIRARQIYHLPLSVNF
jgi:hypothetical protein